jgi:hypothetical protein
MLEQKEKKKRCYDPSQRGPYRIISS